MEKDRATADAIVDSLPLGVLLVDREMQIRYLNEAAQALTGYAVSEVRGRPLAEAFGPTVVGEGGTLAQARESGERIEPRVTTLATKAGSTAGAPALSDQHRLLVGAAPAAGGYVLTLQRASPFHGIDAGRVSDLSHDLRAPLASIGAYTELLVDNVDGGDPELRRQFLGVIEGRTRRLSDLVVNLTGLARWHLGSFQLVKSRVSLGDIVGGVVTERRVQARQQGVRLILDAKDGQRVVLADRDALSIMLNNLIDNAIKFSAEGEDVTVSLQRRGKHHVVRVRDSGCGIEAEDLPNVFEVFYRGGNAVAAGIEGSGLGLPLVGFIVEAHGWEIDLASEAEKGTSVTVTVPAESDAARPS